MPKANDQEFTIEEHDHFVNRCFGLDQKEVLDSLEDITVNGERVEMDVELIPDCDSREDFIEMIELTKCTVDDGTV